VDPEQNNQQQVAQEEVQVQQQPQDSDYKGLHNDELDFLGNVLFKLGEKIINVFKKKTPPVQQ